MRVITLYNTKGGSTKSTLASNLAGSLARRGNQVLLIDGDPQASLSNAIELSHEPSAGYAELLNAGQVGSPTFPKDVISFTNIPGLDIVVSNITTKDLTAKLESSQEGRQSLRNSIDLLRESNPRYSHVIIDSSGTPGVISYTCAIAADRILSPIIPDSINVEAYFTGSTELLNELNASPRWAPYRNLMIDVVLTRTKSTQVARHFINELREKLSPEATQGSLLSRIHILDTQIPEAAVYPKAYALRSIVADMDPKQADILNQLIDELEAAA